MESLTDSPDRPPARRKQRRCLMCGIKFPSEGPHNRICRKCKSSAAWRGS